MRIFFMTTVQTGSTSASQIFGQLALIKCVTHTVYLLSFRNVNLITCSIYTSVIWLYWRHCSKIVLLLLTMSSAKPSSSTNRDNLPLCAPLSVKPWQRMLIRCVWSALDLDMPWQRSLAVSPSLCDPCLWFSLKNPSSRPSCLTKTSCREPPHTHWSVSLLHHSLSGMTS